MAPEARNALITSVTATARKMNSAKYCAVDLAVTYADSAMDELKNPEKMLTEAPRMTPGPRRNGSLDR